MNGGAYSMCRTRGRYITHRVPKTYSEQSNFTILSRNNYQDIFQMKICMPIDQLNGLDSEIAPNFRAAPALLVIDSVSSELFGIDASSGACKATPQHIDAIVCAGGIGRGMFNGLRSHGVRVFNTDAITVKEALAELAAGSLVEVTEVECCGGSHHDRDEAHVHEQGHDCRCSSPDSGEKTKSGCGCNHH